MQRIILSYKYITNYKYCFVLRVLSSSNYDPNHLQEMRATNTHISFKVLLLDLAAYLIFWTGQ